MHWDCFCHFNVLLCNACGYFVDSMLMYMVMIRLWCFWINIMLHYKPCVCRAICLTMSNVTKYKTARWKYFGSLLTQIHKSTKQTTISFGHFIRTFFTWPKYILQMENLRFLFFSSISIWYFVRFCCENLMTMKYKEQRKNDETKNVQWKMSKVIKIAQATRIWQFVSWYIFKWRFEIFSHSNKKNWLFLRNSFVCAKCNCKRMGGRKKMHQMTCKQSKVK